MISIVTIRLRTDTRQGRIKNHVNPYRTLYINSTQRQNVSVCLFWFLSSCFTHVEHSHGQFCICILYKLHLYNLSHTETRAATLIAKESFKPRTFLPWGNSTTHFVYSALFGKWNRDSANDLILICPIYIFTPIWQLLRWRPGSRHTVA